MNVAVKSPIGPLHGIHHAVNAPHETQRLSVDEAIADIDVDLTVADGEIAYGDPA